MKIHFFRPQSPILAKYIEGYYFIKNEDFGDGFSYYTFPNNFQIVSFLKNCQISSSNNHVACQQSHTDYISANLTYNYLSPIQITYQGQINEITIYFKPLGLNHFINNLHVYFGQDASFIDFFPFNDFQESVNALFELPNLTNARNTLEEYWLGKFSNLLHLDQIEYIIEHINDMKIQDIATQLNISRQYLNRVFHHYLGKSPIEFKRIQRFRNTLKATGLNLTELTYENLYYDQSHFIKEIKKVTHNLPKNFFKHIDFKTSNPWLIL